MLSDHYLSQPGAAAARAFRARSVLRKLTGMAPASMEFVETPERQAVQSLGGNGLTKEYGVASLLAVSQTTRVAPVSREMILSFVAQKSLGLPRSY
jgi:alkylation response protein AidB-like acyl-CoA dehydrogenase